MKFINEPFSNQHFNSDNLEDLMMFRKVFDFEKLDREKVQKKLKKILDSNSDKSQEEKIKLQIDFTFKTIIKYFKPESAKGWKSKMVFHIDNVDTYAIEIKDGKAIFTNDTSFPTCNIYTDIGSLTAQLCLIRLEDTRDDDELDDAELEMVAGGKGSSACGGDACGGAAGAGTACGGAACGGAAGAGTACGGQACGGAAGASTVCGEDACGAAACAGDACGVAGCAAAACAGAACGAAYGSGACAANACAVDFGQGADVGPCAINICPGIPGI